MRKSTQWSGLLFVCLSVVAAVMLATPSEVRAQSAPDKEFTIAVGETLTFDARGIRTVSVGLPNIADARTTGGDRELLVTGKTPGVTTINIFAR